MYDLAILSARLANADGFWDIGVWGGKIAAVELAGKSVPAKEQVLAEGRLLLPGIIDAHVHTRDPGYTHKEDYVSATTAAANGGITTIMAMPNTNPPVTTATAVRNADEHLQGRHLVNVRLVGGACAAVPSWILPTAQAGVVALDVYDDVFAYGTSAWIRMFQEAKKAGVPLCFYLMDSSLEQLRAEEATATGASEVERISGATNGATEAMSIARICPMAAYFDVPVVIRMVSTVDAVEMIRHMRKLYPTARIYAEVCVHYLFLTDTDLNTQGGKAHIHPPLRTHWDAAGLWSAIADGTVDYIASDHAPHAACEKQTDSLAGCASGMVGLETMLPLLLDAHAKGKLSLADIQRLCCENPANIYGFAEHKGSIRVGGDADLVLVDTERQWTVSHDDCYTRGAPNPFETVRLRGKPCVTICAGRKVMENGNMIWNSME